MLFYSLLFQPTSWKYLHKGVYIYMSTSFCLMATFHSITCTLQNLLILSLLVDICMVFSFFCYMHFNNKYYIVLVYIFY